jgi:hypothetical protein
MEASLEVPTLVAVPRPLVGGDELGQSGGYGRIQGELIGLGHAVAGPTVWNNVSPGHRPRPQRSGPTWRQFLAAQAHALLAVDFPTSTPCSLRHLYVQIVTEHSPRRVYPAESPHPTGAWVNQQGRPMELGDQASRFRFLIRNKDGKFGRARRPSRRTPPASPPCAMITSTPCVAALLASVPVVTWCDRACRAR